MEILVKSSTPLRFSRRVDSYEPLDEIVRGDEDESGRGKESGGDDDGSGSRRSVSGKMKSRLRQSPIMAWTTSLSYRRERARKRLIFLRGYKLQSSSVRSRTGRLRKVVVRVIRTAVVKVVSFMRRCNTRSGIRVIGSPARVFRCC
nr:NDR1/HIN1-like protein 6 [Ipomoea batatas]GMD63821.1 NDR1/HIN1-like protein 6 [Ipomoea batatas]GME01000.1 NDR1/HIN1-like protein 6 [Ipomoea batatas]GME02612.1 NDR1/HIN1-like protein 6 [Ipomoea batatas]